MPQVFLFLTRVFGEKSHAEEFLRGQVRAGTLRSYRELEDESRSDPMEGVFDSSQFDGLKITLRASNGYTHTLSHETGERMKMAIGWAERFNVLCTTESYVDTEWVVPAERYDEVIARYVHIPEAVMRFGDFAVCIHQPHEFEERVKAAAGRLGVSMDCGSVTYGRHPMPNLGMRDVALIFRKREQYKYEREFRFAFESPHKVEGPLVLDVGDLNDIAQLLRTREFNDQLTITCGESAPGESASEDALGWQDDL